MIANGLNLVNDELKMRDFCSPRISNAVVLVFKSLNSLSCDPFNGYFQRIHHQQNTRNSDYCLHLPKVKLETARKGFCFQGALTFDRLPIHVRQLNSIVLFKNTLKQLNNP